MKKTKLYPYLQYSAYLLTYIPFIFFIYSCSKNSTVTDLTDSDAVVVKVSVQSVYFEDAINFINKASSEHNRSQQFSDNLQRNTVSLGKNLLLVAELSPESSGINHQSSLSTFANNGGNRAASEVANLSANVRYKVVVYDNTGLYITERDYSYEQESTTTPLQLDGSKNYTFICYSVNSTSSLPPVVFTNTNNKTLSTSSVSLAGNQDLMYYRKDMTVLGGSTSNNLNITFKHLLSQITTTFDATSTGYNITAVSSSFSPHLPTAVLNFSDGSISRSGTAGSSAVTFGTINSPTATASPTIINSASNSTTSYTISSITIGPLTQNNITPFTNLVITPGVKYNMKLNIVPTDEYLTYQGQLAVRLNGTIWMRHNLGANTSLDPDQNPSVEGLHGYYYQWGRSAVVATTLTPAGAISGWDVTAVQPLTLWNTGTDQAPVKTSSDPCPTGYRIPTEAEFDALEQATVKSNIGTWNQGASSVSNFSAAKVFKSKRNANVVLTLPIAGNRGFDNGGLRLRGSDAYYWSSKAVANRYYHLSIGINSPATGNIGNSVSAWAFPLRCVKQ